MKAWIRRRLPTWAQVLVLSRTMLGVLMGGFGLVAAHSEQVQALVSQIPGAQPWHVTAAGLALAGIARLHDAYRDNPP